MRWAVLLIVAGCGRFAFDDRDVPADADAADAIDAASDAPPRARPSVVQSEVVQLGDSPSVSVLLGTPTLAGSTVVVGTLNFNVGGTAAPTTGVTDNAGNAYQSTNARGTWTGTQGQVEIWYSPNATVGTTFVTVTSAAKTSRSVWVLELANVDGDAPLDATNAISDGLTNGMPAGPVVNASTGPSVIVSVILLSGSVTQLTAGGVFQPLPLINGDAAAYAIVDAPGTYGAVWDAPGSDNYGASTATFLGAD